MKKITLIAAAAVAILFAFKPAETTWTVDKAHAKLGFSVSHLMVSDVDGSFKNFEAKITSSHEDLSDAVVEVTGQVNSINTDNEQRDAHLKGPDFFDAAKFATFTFKSKSVKKVAENKYKIAGDLTLHGVTKPLELDATCKFGMNPMSKKNIVGVKVSGTIKRTDFGIAATTPSSMVGDEVTILGNGEFTKN
jgi:polyisoprenoid-binding protein YceI